MSELYRAYKLATRQKPAVKSASVGKMIRHVGAMRPGAAAAGAAGKATGAFGNLRFSPAEALALRVGSGGLLGATTGHGLDSAGSTLTGNDSTGRGAALGGLLGAASGLSGGTSYLFKLLRGKGLVADTARNLTAYGAAVPVIRGVQSAAGSEYDVTRPIQTMVRPAQAKQQELEAKLMGLAKLRDKYRWLLG